VIDYELSRADYETVFGYQLHSHIVLRSTASAPVPDPAHGDALTQSLQYRICPSVSDNAVRDANAIGFNCKATMSGVLVNWGVSDARPCNTMFAPDAVVAAMAPVPPPYRTAFWVWEVKLKGPVSEKVTEPVLDETAI